MQFIHVSVSLCVFSSPHMIFLSQSVLAGNKILCGTRLCHEIAHSWFGLAIGARDWTEEWISEGFATYLEDVFWAKIQQVFEPQKYIYIYMHVQHSFPWLPSSLVTS